MQILKQALNVIAFFVIFMVIVAVVLVSWDKVSDAKIEKDVASLVFTAATVQIGIAITLLKHSWSASHRIGSQIPDGQRRIKLNLKGIDDRTVKSRYEVLLSLGMISAFLGLSLFFQLFALVGVGDIMLGLKLGPSAAENYQWGLFAAEWGLLFFVGALMMMGFVYFGEAAAFMGGKPSLLFPKRTGDSGKIQSQSGNSAHDEIDS